MDMVLCLRYDDAFLVMARWLRMHSWRDRAEEEQNTSTWKLGNSSSPGQLAIQRLQYGNAVPVALTFSMNTRWVFFRNEQSCLLDLLQSQSEGVTDHDEDFPSIASEVCAALPGFSICPYPVCVAHIFDRR